jgi:UDP-N-acetylmuramoyl-tripeptide--D-alanyl-D-alanine ligase
MMKIFKKIVLVILRMEASLVLKRHKPYIIGVTGSVGKTSTKEAIWVLLKQFYDVRKSPKTYNSSIGLPLTVLNLPNAWHSPYGWTKNLIVGFTRIFSRAKYPELLVLEMGVDRPGDFDQMLAWVKPDIAVVTPIGDVPPHVEFFEGPDGVAEEKVKLVKNIKTTGHVILNSDDKRVYSMRKVSSGQVHTYGFGSSAVIQGQAYKLLVKQGMPSGISFKIEAGGKTVPIRIEGVLGTQHATALLAATAVGLVKGLNLLEISEGLEKYQSPPGRLSLIAGKKKSLIIDDSYNSSPLAAYAALDLIRKIQGHRKIAVMGDMLEIGKFTIDSHRDVGAHAAGAVDIVIAVGVRAKFMETSNAKFFRWFATSGEAADFLEEFIEANDLILIKGSQGVRMEKIVRKLMLDPGTAHEKLVRQEDYWKKN